MQSNFLFAYVWGKKLSGISLYMSGKYSVSKITWQFLTRKIVKNTWFVFVYHIMASIYSNKGGLIFKTKSMTANLLRISIWSAISSLTDLRRNDLLIFELRRKKIHFCFSRQKLHTKNPVEIPCKLIQDDICVFFDNYWRQLPDNRLATLWNIQGINFDRETVAL